MFVTAGVWVMVIRQTERVAGVPVTVRQGEMASGLEQPGTHASDILCHRLFFVENFKDVIVPCLVAHDVFLSGFCLIHPETI